MVICMRINPCKQFGLAYRNIFYSQETLTLSIVIHLHQCHVQSCDGKAVKNWTWNNTAQRCYHSRGPPKTV